MAFVRAFSGSRLHVCWIFLLLALAIPAHSQAAVRCISSGSDFKTVMDDALASAETFEDVRIKAGLIDFTTGSIGYFGVLEGTDKVLQISGGWSGTVGNCTSRSNNIGATILWGNDQRRVFSINASTTFTGSIIIENLTVGGGLATTSAPGSCLALGEQNGGVMGIRLDRVRVTGCNTSPTEVDSPAVALTSHAGLIVRNSIIDFNFNAIGAPVTFAALGGLGFFLNNTVVNNTSGNVNGFAGVACSASDGASMTLGNNLFDLNTATAAARRDIRVGPNVTLVNNRFTGLSGVPVSNTGSTTGPAGFLSPTNLNLAANSTARDAGAFFAPILQGALDSAGQGRIFGPAVDLGAFEFSILFEDGFETP